MSSGQFFPELKRCSFKTHADHLLSVKHCVRYGTAAAAAAAQSLQSCPTLCDPIDGSPPGSPVPGILQARTLEWVPFLSPMDESEKRK